MGVLQFQSLRISLLPMLTNTIVKRFHLMFLLHQFGSCLGEQVIPVSIKKRFRNFRGARISENRFIACSLKHQQVALSRKTRLDSTFSNVKTMQQVSVCPWKSDLETNWTSSLLLQSDKLAILPHLLLAPMNTVVKPAEHDFVRCKSASWGVARLSTESWVEDNNDWLHGEENGSCINSLPLSSIPGIWLSSVECSCSCLVTIGLSTVLLGTWPVRGSGSVYPSPLGSRRSAQEFLDVSNLWRPATEEKVEDEVLGVLCGTRDRAREMNETTILGTQSG